jgi:hypothetical protein
MNLSVRNNGLIVLGCVTTGADNCIFVGDNRTNGNFASLRCALCMS